MISAGFFFSLDRNYERNLVIYKDRFGIDLQIIKYLLHDMLSSYHRVNYVVSAEVLVYNTFLCIFD